MTNVASQCEVFTTGVRNSLHYLCDNSVKLNCQKIPFILREVWKGGWPGCPTDRPSRGPRGSTRHPRPRPCSERLDARASRWRHGQDHGLRGSPWEPAVSTRGHRTQARRQPLSPARKAEGPRSVPPGRSPHRLELRAASSRAPHTAPRTPPGDPTWTNTQRSSSSAKPEGCAVQTHGRAEASPSPCASDERELLSQQLRTHATAP